jgi:hypothetical protein
MAYAGQKWITKNRADRGEYRQAAGVIAEALRLEGYVRD